MFMVRFTARVCVNIKVGLGSRLWLGLGVGLLFALGLVFE